MYSVPDVDEVVAVAKQLGIHLSADEAALYRKHLVEQLSQLDVFVQARVEEPRPPMASAGREPGWRPSPHEDPLNAWMWKCRIEGAAEGLLKGKTMLVGRFFDDPLLMRVAYAYQHATDWDNIIGVHA